MKRIIGTLAITGLLSGCLEVSPETAAAKSIPQLCLAVLYVNNQVAGPESKAAAMAEITRRGGFTASELRQIAVSKPVPGMSEAAGLCAWGYAQNGVNTTITAAGTMKQFTYGKIGVTSLRYLYTLNGRVTTIQQF